MEELDMSLVELLIRKEEIKWLTSRLLRIWNSDIKIRDVVRNENNELEIRVEKIVFEEEKESD